MTATAQIYRTPLTIGLPHTNYSGLSEAYLMMQAGHYQWNSIAAAFGKPLSQLRTPAGEAIYATYYYIELDFPPGEALSDYKLDQSLLFINALRHFKGIAIDGTTFFGLEKKFQPGDEKSAWDKPDTLKPRFPYLRMCNIFISQASQNTTLKLSPPADVPFDHIATLDPAHHAYPLVRLAAQTLTFGLLNAADAPLHRDENRLYTYAINPERDTNGAGLVYFANYISFIEMAERDAIVHNCSDTRITAAVNTRSLLKRRIAYYGNVNPDESIQIKTHLYKIDGHLGVRSMIYRQSDGKLIALSEAIKRL